MNHSLCLVGLDIFHDYELDLFGGNHSSWTYVHCSANHAKKKTCIWTM